MEANFDPSCVRVLDESSQDCINRYTFPRWMFVPHKPRPFGNEYHTTACAKYKVIYNVEILEGKDRPIVMGENEFE